MTYRDIEVYYVVHVYNYDMSYILYAIYVYIYIYTTVAEF